MPSPIILNGVAAVPLEAVERAVRFLASAYEFVLIDCPLGLSDLTLVTVDCCDELYVVATNDVPALRDLSKYVDRLSQCMYRRRS